MTAPEKHPQHAGLDELRRRLDKARGIEQVLSVYQRILETAEELRSSPETSKSSGGIEAPGAKEDGQTARDTASSWRRPEIPRCTAETPSDGLGDYFQRIGAVAAEAAVPEPLFRRYCREMVDCGMEPTARGLARVACNDPSSTGMPDEMGPVLSLSPAALCAMAGQGRRFGCVHAAPPWPLDHPRRRDRKDFFKTMTRSLCDLPVADVCAESGASLPMGHPSRGAGSGRCARGMGFSVSVLRPLEECCRRLRWLMEEGTGTFASWGPRRPPVLGGLTAAFDGSSSNSNSDRWPEFCRLIERVSPIPILICSEICRCPAGRSRSLGCNDDLARATRFRGSKNQTTNAHGSLIAAKKNFRRLARAPISVCKLKLRRVPSASSAPAAFEDLMIDYNPGVGWDIPDRRIVNAGKRRGLRQGMGTRATRCVFPHRRRER